MDLNLPYIMLLKLKLISQRATASSNRNCAGLKIETLMWKRNGRYFDTIGMVTVNGDIYIRFEIFPNIEFGYNLRTFKAATLEVRVFIF